MTAGDAARHLVSSPRDRRLLRGYLRAGGGGQTVVNAWSSRLAWNHLADRNIIVFQMDNRGLFGRGPAFEAPVHKGLDDVELKNQIAGLEYLKSLPFADTGRVAIRGAGYGRMMAVLAGLRFPRAESSLSRPL